jgi:hypothetical protein
MFDELLGKLFFLFPMACQLSLQFLMELNGLFNFDNLKLKIWLVQRCGPKFLAIEELSMTHRNYQH